LLSTALFVLGGGGGQLATGALVGADRCSWGPAFWCASLQQASGCDAVSHCIQSVWSKETVPVDDDEVCTICKEMVAEARDTLISNETQEELKEVFDGSCDLIPLKLIAKECRTLADQFVPELVETLASEMNPDTVCTVSGLCNSARIDTMLEKYYSQHDGTPVCEKCQGQMKQVQYQLNKIPDYKLESKLLELCGYLGSYSDACRYTVTTELKSISSLLKEIITTSLCDVEGICAAGPPGLPITSNSLQPSEDLQCEFCEKVVKHWIDVYASKSSLEEFKQLLDGICEKLDTKNAAHCKHIVDDYYMPLFEYVRNLDPHMVCSLVGLCGNSGFLEDDYTGPITLLFSEPQETAMVPLTAAQQTDSSDPEEKPSCVLCEYVLREIQMYLKDGNTEAEIKEYVEAVCEDLPSSVRDECKKLVDQYEPLIVAMLVDEVDPQQVCTELRLCGTAQVLVLQSEKKTPRCETCEFVMQEVFSVLTDKDDQDMVRNVLESICYRLPTSIDIPCENFVDKYTASIMNLISEFETPEGVCAAMDLCEDDEVPEPEVEDTGCVLCEYVISNLDQMLEDKDNEAAIRHALDNVCSYLPSSVTKECTNFVDTYTDIIIDMLTKEVTPSELCTELGLCKPKDPATDIQVVDTGKGAYCTLCEYAMTALDQALEDSRNIYTIEKEMEVLCQSLTAPVHKECVKMVDKYTSEIINMLIDDYPPQMICSELALCVNSEISSNDVYAVDFTEDVIIGDDDEEQESVGCVMCEFAMEVIDEHLDDSPTVDQVERVVQFMCSYMPGTIADKCEAFVDKYGQRLIDALVKDDLNPAKVCTLDLNLCTGGAGRCEFGPELWCSTPFHIKLCGAEKFCQATSMLQGIGPVNTQNFNF